MREIKSIADGWKVAKEAGMRLSSTGPYKEEFFPNARALGALLDERDALCAQLAAEREAREKAERERDRLAARGAELEEVIRKDHSRPGDGGAE